MQGIVLDLQRDALDPTYPLADLLRKALVVARKLKIGDFESWIDNELNGYRGPEGSVPKYRLLHGQVKCHNPYHGWQPMAFDDPEIGEALSQRSCGESVAALENLLAQEKRGSTLMMHFPAATERSLMDAMQPVSLQPVFHFPVAQAAAILDTVRSTVLSWSLRLEQDGILGDGFAFSTREKEQASASAYHVNNFFGAVSQSQFAAGAEQPVQIVLSPSIDIDEVKALVAKIKRAMPEVGLDPDSEAELRAELSTLDSQVSSPRPKKGIVKQCLASVRAILEGAGGSAAGSLIVELAKMIHGS